MRRKVIRALVVNQSSSRLAGKSCCRRIANRWAMKKSGKKWLPTATCAASIQTNMAGRSLFFQAESKRIRAIPPWVKQTMRLQTILSK